jgi:hypothetical protein
MDGAKLMGEGSEVKGDAALNTVMVWRPCTWPECDCSKHCKGERDPEFCKGLFWKPAATKGATP